MIGLSFKRKLSAVFLNSCFLMPMVLITLVISITPIVQADSVCEVPASNSWDIDERINYHYLNDWFDGLDSENQPIWAPPRGEAIIPPYYKVNSSRIIR